MNVVKYYRVTGEGGTKKIEVFRMRIPGGQRYNTASGHTGIAKADAMELRNGLTRRRPPQLRPHAHPAQRPGYKQPSAQEQRKARQLLRRAGKKAA